MALQEQGLPHARCVVLIEACEESGSYDLPAYVDHLADRIGRPSLVVCLDSGCGNYDQLWCTTSLRGMAGGISAVKVLSEGVHSGDASGVMPVELPPAAPAALPPGGRGHRPHPARGAARRDPRRAPRDQAQPRPKCWAMRSTTSSRSVTACGRCTRTWPNWCSTAPGARRCRSPGWTACRRWARPATCCARTPRSSCRCGCRQPWTASKPVRCWKTCCCATRRTAPKSR
jgi:hypothetical protein